MEQFDESQRGVNKINMLRKNLVKTKNDSKVRRYKKQSMQQVLNAGLLMRL